MAEITKDMLLAKRGEYVKQMQMHQNTVIAIQGAIESIDELLTISDSLSVDDFKDLLGAKSVEIIENKEQ